MRTRLVQGCAAIALLALAACGGTTNTGATNPSNTASVSSSPSATDTASTGATAFSSAECQSAALAMAAAAAGGFGSSASAPSPQQAIDTLKRIAAAAPSAVRADLTIVANALHDFYAALQSAGVDFTKPSTFSSQKAQQALQKAEADFRAAGGENASRRIQTYFAGVCPGA